MKQQLFKLTMLLAAVLLSGCGYRLCNPCIAWPENVAQVFVSSSDPSSTVYRELQRNLASQGLEVTPSEAAADVVFVLLRESQEQRLLAVGNGNEPAEYELIYKVSYRIDQRNLEPSGLPFLLGPVKVVESRRAQVFNSAAVLAVEREALSLYDEMARYLANQISRSALGQLSGQPVSEQP